MAILSAWARKGIVSHCFPVNAGRVRGGGMVGEEGRGQGQKRLPALAGLYVRPGFGLSQTLASKPGTAGSPDRFSPAAWSTAPALGMSRHWRPALASRSPNSATAKQALASLGTVHWDIRFQHQISSLQLHWGLMSFPLLQLTGSNPKQGTVYCWIGTHLSQRCYLSMTCMFLPFPGEIFNIHITEKIFCTDEN